MYFVKNGDICIRYIGTEKWDERELPDFTSYYDYDDEEKWSFEKLKRETKRISAGKDFDMDAMVAVEAEISRRKFGDNPDTTDDWDEVLDTLEKDEGDWEEDESVRRPIIYPDEISLPTRKLIADVAKIEHEEMAFRKENYHKSQDQIDVAAVKKFLALEKKGWKAREALLDSDLGKLILEMYDPVEDMKTMAAQMLFLYSQERMKAETEGGEPDEDFFYAGSNLYAHAVVDQMSDENDNEDADEDDSDYVFSQDMDMDTMATFAEAFSEHIRHAEPDDEFMQGMDQVTEITMKEKGFDINTLAGAKAAQSWLENAKVEDAFLTEGPIENAVDWHMGEARLDAMQKCIKIRIQKMIDDLNKRK